MRLKNICSAVTIILCVILCFCCIACGETGDAKGTTSDDKGTNAPPTQTPSTPSEPDEVMPNAELFAFVDEWSDDVKYYDEMSVPHTHENCRKCISTNGVESLFGTWNTYAGTMHGLLAGSYCEFTFTGTAACVRTSWRGKETCDSMLVFIDGKFVGTVGSDVLTSERVKDSENAIIYSVDGLEQGQHVLKIVNAAENGGKLYIDSFGYVNSEAGSTNDMYSDLKTSATSWTVCTGDSEMKLAVLDNELYITSLSTFESDKNMVANNSKIKLPKDIGLNGKRERTELNWVFKGFREYGEEFNGVDADVLELVFDDPDCRVSYSLYIITREHLNGPFEFVPEMTNYGVGNVRCYTGDLVNVTVVSPNNIQTPIAWYFAKESGAAEGFVKSSGSSFKGSGTYNTLLTPETFVRAWCNTYQNHNSNGYIPMIYVDYQTAGVYIALEANAGATTALGGTDSVTIESNINYSSTLSEFSTIINAGSDPVKMPSSYIGVYDGDVDDGSNVFKRWFFNCKSPVNVRENEAEPLTQMDMQLGTGVTHLGIQSIKWDYGWWSNEKATDSSWKTLEGSWQLRSQTYINAVGPSLAAFGKTVEDSGLKSLTMYLLLHDTVDKDGNPVTTEGEFNSADHPDWFTQRIVAKGMGRSADLGNIECVDYLKDTLLDFFKGNNIVTWRTDFGPVPYISNKSNRHESNGSDVIFWNSIGFNEIVDHIQENYSKFRFESCCSGGGMKDLMTSTQASVINIDDSGNYTSMRMTFYDSSYCIPPSQLQVVGSIHNFLYAHSAHWPKYDESISSASGFQNKLLHFGFRSIIYGAVMISCGDHKYYNQYNLTAYMQEYLPMYNEKIKPLVRDAELYHILPRPDGENWDGIMYADPDSKNDVKGLIFIFKPSEKAENTKNIILKGLDPTKNYSLKFYEHTSQNVTKSGAELMETGLNITINGFGSDLIFIYESK